MAQINTGLYALLDRPNIFNGLQKLIVRNDARRILANEYIKAKHGDRLLAIGCGPASLLPYLPGVAYTGIDPTPDYIKRARAEHPAGGVFIAGGVRDLAEHFAGNFDIAIAIGVLHHLDDAEAALLVAGARRALAPGGRLITSDPVFLSRQNPVARLVIGLDRGKRVRSPEGYMEIAKGCFGRVECSLRSDFMRIPYNHCILVCHEPSPETKGAAP